MVTEATTILPLATAKEHLRIEPDRTDLDAAIAMATKSAVSYVQEMTGVPLLDVTEKYLLEPTARDSRYYSRYRYGANNLMPLLIPSKFVREITEVLYWQPSQEQSEDPGGTVAIADLGRIWRGTAVTEQWPPSGGWPSRLYRTAFQVTATLGHDLDVKTEELRQDVAVLMRFFFEAPDEDPPSLRRFARLGKHAILS